MNILFLANAASIHTVRWTDYFASRGHDVHVLSHHPFTGNPPPGVKFHSLKLIPPVPGISYPANMILGALQTRRLAGKVGIDILNAHYLSDFGAMGSLSGIHPFVASVWGSDVLKLNKDPLLMRYMTTLSMKVADMVTTTASQTRDYVIETFHLPPEKVMRIPWGIDLEIFHRGYADRAEMLRESLGLERGAPVILSNRTMSPTYAIESIVEAIPKILEKHPKAVFLFIKGYGTADYEKIIEKRAEDLGIQKSIRIISRLVTPEEMAVFLNASFAFISLPKTDQFAASIMEGMACGTIPVLSDLIVYRQYLDDGKNALFVDPDDPEDIARALNFCLDNPHIREEFYAINRNIIESEEDWSRNAKKMEELYEALLARREN
ncbi:MAG: glycosyltransferase family 4 protein [Methanothrix sp.]